MGFKKRDAYGIYPELDFDKTKVAYTNDSYGRYKICMQELRIIKNFKTII